MLMEMLGSTGIHVKNSLVGFSHSQSHLCGRTRKRGHLGKFLKSEFCFNDDYVTDLKMSCLIWLVFVSS